jgi:hypothetical protein
MLRRRITMNVWGWARLIPTVLGDGAWEKFPNLKRMVDEISARPAAQKAMALKDRHKFKTEGRRGDAGHVPAFEFEGRLKSVFAVRHALSLPSNLRFFGSLHFVVSSMVRMRTRPPSSVAFFRSRAVGF